VKLLFDQNLSFRLVALLADLYPGSIHVRDVGLQAVNDGEVWEYARQHGFMIVSKDVGFHQRSFLLGLPPKVAWVGLGNCSTTEVAALLHQRHREMLAFERSAEAAFLALT
jgi:predicted nuclease of predicted toxin-antitoxin system